MKKLAEYYFDYQIFKIVGEDDIATPKIYFERDLRTEELSYCVFAIPEEWLCRTGKIGDVDEEALPYDRVEFRFSSNGLDCASLTSENDRNLRKRTFLYHHFVEDGCRLLLEKRKMIDYSGVGDLEFFKDGRSVAKFYLAINHTKRKRIDYTLKRTGKQLTLTFDCPLRPVSQDERKVPLSLVYNDTRLPCLRSDRSLESIGFELDFSKSSHIVVKIDLDDLVRLGYNVEKTYFSVFFEEEKMENFYLLNCLSNNSFEVKPYKTYENPTSSCPYCHKVIEDKLVKDKRYKKGGVSCQGNRGLRRIPSILSENGVKIAKGMFCNGEVDEKGKFTTLRLLPHEYVSHDTFKLVCIGSKRAGKTTYVSRFFDVTGDENNAYLNGTMMRNSLKRLGVSVSMPKIPALTFEGGSYKVDRKNWIESNQTTYIDRVVDFKSGKFPTATPTDQNANLVNPFIVEVKGKSYISFYDLAGEDTQKRWDFSEIGQNATSGVFFVVNGVKDSDGNQRVASQLNGSGMPKDCPVAVILAKSDMIASEFDANAHAIRSDYLDHPMTRYEGSYLERKIDMISEEVRSYLIDQKMLPPIENYENVKYFAVSSFNFKESIHEEGDDFNEPGRELFRCSGRNLELPFLWMLKQFGVID